VAHFLIFVLFKFDRNMDILSLEHFVPRLNETFIALSDGHAPFVLVEARPLTNLKWAGMLRAPFSLLFRNESPVLFMQKIYRLKHQTLGELGIFLLPIGRDRDGFLYQAIFN
jgi:hypothetical protein